MQVVSITKKDYNDVFVLTKELLNHQYFLTEENNLLIDALAHYAVGFLVKHATHGYFVENDNKERIGLIVFSIPNAKPLFDIRYLDVHGTNLKKYVRENQVTPIESQLIRYEMDTIKNSLHLIRDFNKFVVNKAEISVLYIKEEYQGKGISRSLLSKFYDDILLNGNLDFYLYTTNFYNYNFYEKLKMKKISKLIYDEKNAPSYIKKKVQIPYYGMLYFGERKRIFQ